MSGSPFRRRNAQALYDAQHGPNMTPMVDVVMVILIFFMASAAFLGPEWFLRTGLPTPAAGAAQESEARTLLLSMTRDASGQTTTAARDGKGLEQPGIAIDEIEAFLRSQSSPNLTVVVSPSDEVPYDDVVQVHEIAARLGISKIGIVRPAAPATPGP